MKKISIIFMMFLCMVSLNCQENINFHNTYSQHFENYLKIKNQHFQNAVLLEKYLPKGYKKDGSVNYSKEIQNAINENNVLIFPDFPMLISPRSIKLRSNTKILFPKNSQLIIQSNNLQSYWGILFEEVDNVELFFVNIKGDKYSHRGKEGQWGQGISIRGSQNIKIFYPHITQCWGDGIYIGGNHPRATDSVLISGAFVNDNRRNGVSIISGKNIIIENSFIGNSSGQNPQSGIDVEPNNNNNIIQNIILENITTFNNKLHGIIISTGNIAGKNKRDINILVKNHMDYNSNIAMGIGVTRNNQPSEATPITGSIMLAKLNYKNNKTAFKLYKGKHHKVNLKINSLTINGQINVQSFTQKNATLNEIIDKFSNSQNLEVK